jgi:hypothetical protein
MASASARRPPVPDDRGSLQPDFRLLAVATVCLLAVLALSAIGPAMSGGPGGDGIPGGGGDSPIWDVLAEYLPVDLLTDVGSRIGGPIRDVLFDLLGGFADALDPQTFADAAKTMADLLKYLDPETVSDIGGALADVLPLLNGGVNSPGDGESGDDGSSNQLLETVLGALAVVLVLAVLAATLWRWCDLLWAALRRAGGRSASVLRAIPSLLVDLAVRIGRALEVAAGRLTDAARRLVTEPAETVRSALVALPGAVRALPGRIAAAMLSLLLALLPNRLVAWLRRVVLGEEPAETNEAVDGVGAARRAGDAEGRSVLDLQALWRAFVSAVRPPNLSTKTPGEVGRYAVDRGFPSGPTQTIVDTYRAAEYGNRQPSEGRLERVLAAVREVTGDDAPDGEVGQSVDVGPGEDVEQVEDVGEGGDVSEGGGSVGTPMGDGPNGANPSSGAAADAGESAEEAGGQVEAEEGGEVEERGEVESRKEAEGDQTRESPPERGGEGA